MNDKVKTALQSWVKEREKQNVESEFIFVSNRNKRLERTKLIQEYSKKLGKEITPHDLRHFAISKGISTKWLPSRTIQYS
jgi:integrase/recombinase XerD